MNRIIVTGATGFIGRNLCAYLQEQGIHVRALMRNKCQGLWDEALVADLANSTGDTVIVDEVSTVYIL